MYEHQEQAHKAAIEAIITETRDSYACSISCKRDGTGETPYEAALNAVGSFEFEFSRLQNKHKQLLPVIESLREKFKQHLMG